MSGLEERLSPKFPRRLTILIAFASAMAIAMLALRWDPIRGVEGYWQWKWSRFDLGRTFALLTPGLSLLGVALWIGRRSQRRANLIAAISLMTAASFLLQIGAFVVQSRALGRVARVIQGEYVTSYFTDALEIRDSRDFLAQFHRDDLDLALHSNTHPPGPILYYRSLQVLLGPERSAFWSGLLLGVVSALGVPLMYRFASGLDDDAQSRSTSAALYSLLPGIVLFFPGLDATYPLITMGLIVAWSSALGGSRRGAIVLGGLMFLASFLAYNLLLLGVFFAVHIASISISRGSEAKRGALTLGVAAAIALVCHVVLALSTGYRPVASFFRSLDWQRGQEQLLGRSWRVAVAWDLADFALAGGVVVPLLAIATAVHWWILRRGSPSAAWLWAGFATILAVNLSGLLRAETARVWLFLQPFVIAPAGWTLARMRTSDRIVIFLALAAMLVALRWRLRFIFLF